MAIEPLILLNGTTADANQVMALFNEIYDNITDVNVAANAGILFSKLQALTVGKIIVGNNASVPAEVTMHGGATIDVNGLVTLSPTGSGGTVPIGTLVPFLDYDGLNTFDPVSWQMSDGGPINSGPMAGKSTEDLSGRYLIGFGTDGGGNIGSTAWAVGAVGNASSHINIQHTHLENSHTHSTPNHSHTLSNHTHDLGNHTHTSANHAHTISTDGSHSHTTPNHQHLLAFDSLTGRLTSSGAANELNSLDADNSILYDNNSAAVGNPYRRYYNQTQNSGSGTTDIQGSHNHTGVTGATTPFPTGTPSVNTSGTPSVNSTDTSGGGVTGNQSDTGMSNSLSTAQDIRPSSIRCRYILRIA